MNEADKQVIQMVNENSAAGKLAKQRKAAAQRRRDRVNRALRRLAATEAWVLGAAMGCVVALQGFVLPGCLVVAACAAGVTANARMLRR